MVTIIIFIFLCIILPYPVEVTTGAIDTTGGLQYPPYEEYTISTEKPMYMVLINGGHWQVHTDIYQESVIITQEYDANFQYMIYYIPAMTIFPFIISCFLEEYYRLKSLKSK